MDHVATMSNEERKARLFGPIAAVTIGAILLLVIVTTFLVRQFDRSALHREQQVVEHGFRQRAAEIEASVVSQIQWDDAVQNLDLTFRPAWADQKIASYLAGIAGVRAAFVVDGRERLVYASVDGRRAALDSFDPYAQTVRGLLPAVRAKERAGAALMSGSATNTMVSKPIQASALAMVEDTPTVITATLVQPDFGKVTPRMGTSAVVVTAVPLCSVFLSQFANRYQLDDLKVANSRDRDLAVAAIPLRGVDHQEIAVLQWTSRSPGSQLLKHLVLPFILVTGLFVGIVTLLARRSSAIASDLIASEARAKHLAYHDTLTQLPNRAFMFDRLRQILALARRFNTHTAVHCIDLDRFKEVNDSLGHHAGDELIRAVGKRLLAVCREMDTVARLGGDEFVILQPATDSTGASHLAQRVAQAFRDPIELDYGQVEIGCSIGVTIVTNADIEPTEALRQADLALYRAKETGRGRTNFFEPEMDAALRMRRSLEADLRKALAEGALTMAYQPQVDNRGQIRGIEALVRWTHAEKGPISPAVFVPLAEESGLILDLGEFVFRRVFSETKGWRKFRTAINVSAVQLRSSGFAPLVSALMREFEVNPGDYEIEITETALLGDESLTVSNLNFLKSAGFSIALDDFGTGYSSLSCLQRYAVDKIKIDRSFISNLAADEESEALVDAIVKLARALKLDIIAEGVETQEQRDRLMACGCCDIQGFLISRPVPAEEIVTMLDTLRVPTDPK
jgi:diguanylate cyclase (GGDEF)-like protein